MSIVRIKHLEDHVTGLVAEAEALKARGNAAQERLASLASQLSTQQEQIDKHATSSAASAIASSTAICTHLHCGPVEPTYELRVQVQLLAKTRAIALLLELQIDSADYSDSLCALGQGTGV